MASFSSLPNRRATVYRSRTLIVEFEMNRAGIARVAVGPDLQDATRAVVRERALPYAIRISPRSNNNDPDHVHYQESFHISQGFTVIAGMRRAAAKLINVAPHAAAVEFINARGNGNGTRVLGKTLDHLNQHGGTLAAAKKPWRPELHPRGPGGRFTRKT